VVVDQRERHLVVGVGREREVRKLLANLLVVVDLAVADQEQAPSSVTSGCLPPPTSTIDRRRCPSQFPPTDTTPQSSGPR